MDTLNKRERIIREFLGLEELSPMESGEVRGGKEKGDKQFIKVPPKTVLDVEIDL